MNNNKTRSFFINRRPISWLILITIVLMGIFSLRGIPLELQPEINIPFASVTTVLPGANPTDIESLVTEPLEKEIGPIDGIKTMSSKSSLGLSLIVLEFAPNTDFDKAIQDIKDKIDLAKNELPDDATDPQVIRAEANSLPIITFSISGERTLYDLTQIAESIQDKLENISGVSRVELIGGQKKEIQITIDQDKANELGITMDNIANALNFSNLNLPIGVITTDKINYSIRIDNRFQSLDDIQNTSIHGNILIKDIAKVEEKLKERPVISKLSTEGKPSEETISMQIFKEDEANIIEVADTSKEAVNKILKDPELNDLEITVSNDNSHFIRTDLGILIKNGIQTTILIIFILFLALGFKEGILAGLSIPLTLLTALTIMDFQGLSINSLTLFSLVIALGLMVDTAIVIMEGIHENLKKRVKPKQAAINSIETYKWALIAGTMTTVFAFFPMLLVSGIVGEFLKALPITISAVLLSSIVISLTILPSLAVKFVKKVDPNKRNSILEPLFEKLGHLFEKFIATLVNKRSTRIIVILMTLILFAGSLSLPITGILKVEMFPKTEVPYFIINIESPKGLIIEETEKLVSEVENELYKVKEIDNFLTIIGTSQGVTQTDLVDFGGSKESNLANITVNLIDEKLRTKRSYEIAEELRKKFEKYTGTKVTVQEISEGPPSGSPIGVKITGEDFEKLKEISANIQDIIKKVPGTQNIKDNFTPGINEFKFTLDRESLNYHGLTVGQVSQQIRNIIQGVKATNVSFNNKDIDLLIKYDIPEKYKIPQISISRIENFKILSPKGYMVNLSELGKYEFGESLSSISREDQKRILQISADLEIGANAKLVTQSIQEKLDSYELPSGYNISFGGETEDIDESFRDLFRSMIIGVILIGATLVLMFNSLKQPFIIMLSLPLALIGVFPGLMLIGLQLSFPAFLGVVALSGVVVNDSIVLIDRINKNRKKRELGFRESISEATRARLQPILMTSITTIVGILPLALSNEFWAGLGFSLIFGLTFSTILVLVVIPVLYFMIEGRKARKAGELS